MKNNVYLLMLFVLLLAFPQICETLIAPVMPKMAHSLDVSHQWVELSVSLFFAGFALGVCFWGISTDWWGRLKAMRYGLIVFSAGSAACAFAQNIEQLYLATIVQAFGASCGSIVTQTILRDLYTDKEERGKIFAIIGISLCFSPALGPLLGHQLSLWLDWRNIFLFLACLGVALLLWSWLSLTETRPATPQSRSINHVIALAKTMLSDRFLIACTLLVGISNAIIFCFFAERPYIFVEYLQIPPEEFGAIGIAVSLSIFVAGILNHRLIGGLGAEKLISMGALVMTIGSALYLFTSYFISINGGTGFLNAFALIAPLFLIFLGSGMMISNLLSIALKDYQDEVGSAGSLFGLGYTAVLSVLMAGMSFLHSDNITPMPCYFLALSLGAYLVSQTLKKVHVHGGDASLPET